MRGNRTTGLGWHWGAGALMALALLLFLIPTLAHADISTAITGNARIDHYPANLTDVKTKIYVNYTDFTGNDINMALIFYLTQPDMVVSNGERFDGASWVPIEVTKDDELEYGVYDESPAPLSTTEYRFDVRINPTTTDGEYSVSATDMTSFPPQTMVMLDPWYSGPYLYRRQLTCTNPTAQAVANFPCEMKFNHAAEVSAGRALASGLDTIITDSTSLNILDFLQLNNTNNTGYYTVRYRAPLLNPGANTFYWYYGNRTTITDRSNQTGTFSMFDEYWPMTETNTPLFSMTSNALNLTNKSGTPTSVGVGCRDGRCFLVGAGQGFNQTLPGGAGDKYANPANLSAYCWANLTGTGIIQPMVGVFTSGGAVFSWDDLIWSNNSHAFYGSSLLYGSTFNQNVNRLYGFNRTGTATTVTINGTSGASSSGGYNAPTTPYMLLGNDPGRSGTMFLGPCALAIGAKAVNINSTFFQIEAGNDGSGVGTLTNVSSIVETTTLCKSPGCTSLSTLYQGTDLQCSAFVYGDSLTLSSLNFSFWRNGTYFSSFTTANVANGTTQFSGTVSGSNILNSDSWACEANLTNAGSSSVGWTSNFTVTTANMTILAFDESNGNPLYFTATISNTTTSQNIPYTNLLSQSELLAPSGTITILVSNSSYYSRSYMTENNYNSNINISAYLLNISNGYAHSVGFYVVTSATQPISGAVITLTRNVNGSIVTVANSATDNTGVVSFYLDSTVPYTVSVNAAGYPAYSATITPSLSSYMIILGNSQNLTQAENRFTDIDWSLTPVGPLNWNSTTTFNYSIASVSGKNSIVWYAMSIFNGSTLLSFQNASGNGGSLTYAMVPGTNANITVYLSFMHNNQSLQSLASWFYTYFSFNAPAYTFGATFNQTVVQVLHQAGQTFHPITISMVTLLIAVGVSGMLNRINEAAAVIGFLCFVGAGWYIGAGVLASSFMILITVLFLGAYYISFRGAQG